MLLCAEGIAFGSRTMVDAIEAASAPLAQLTVVGGATRSAMFMQLLADVIGKRHRRAELLRSHAGRCGDRRRRRARRRVRPDGG